MQLRYLPSTVLYGLATALVLSLAFNLYLLTRMYQLEDQVAIDDAQTNLAASRSEYWEQKWSDCAQQHLVEDSVLQTLHYNNTHRGLALQKNGK